MHTIRCFMPIIVASVCTTKLNNFLFAAISDFRGLTHRGSCLLLCLEWYGLWQTTWITARCCKSCIDCGIRNSLIPQCECLCWCICAVASFYRPLGSFQTLPVPPPPLCVVLAFYTSVRLFACSYISPRSISTNCVSTVSIYSFSLIYRAHACFTLNHCS